jgi:hypothetical protein
MVDAGVPIEVAEGEAVWNVARELVRKREKKNRAR